jgi:hypothetical protein
VSRDTRFLETRNREQASLYGLSLREAVAGEGEVLALEAALAQLDFGKLEAGYPETGHQDPKGEDSDALTHHSGWVSSGCR